MSYRSSKQVSEAEEKSTPVCCGHFFFAKKKKKRKATPDGGTYRKLKERVKKTVWRWEGEKIQKKKKKRLLHIKRWIDDGSADGMEVRGDRWEHVDVWDETRASMWRTHRPAACTLHGVHVGRDAHQPGAPCIVLTPAVLVGICRSEHRK